jgi:ubiquinol-cytochrome c reductase cytochrome b subunit
MPISFGIVKNSNCISLSLLTLKASSLWEHLRQRGLSCRIAPTGIAPYIFQPRRTFYVARLPSSQRIGPHSEEIISTLVGNLLADGWGEKRSGSSRFQIHMGSPNVEYLRWLHRFFAERGYCNADHPKLTIQIGKEGRVFRSFRFKTWSFRSLNWLYDAFFNEQAVKQIPGNIEDLLTPRALAVWLMDDGGVSGVGVKISTEGAQRYSEVVRLQEVLQKKFGLLTTIQRHKSRWILYFPKSQMVRLSTWVQPFMIPSMYYKIHLTLRAYAGGFEKKKVSKKSEEKRAARK